MDPCHWVCQRHSLSLSLSQCLIITAYSIHPSISVRMTEKKKEKAKRKTIFENTGPVPEDSDCLILDLILIRSQLHAWSMPIESL